MSWRCVGRPISLRLSARSSAKMSLRISSMADPSGTAPPHFAGGIENRSDDRLVAGAPADVAANGIDDVLAARVGIVVEQRLRSHQHAGSAIAALRREMLHEGSLQRVEIGTLSQARGSFDRCPST